MAEFGATLRDARRQSLVQLATLLNIQNATNMTKQQISNEIWAATQLLLDMVNTHPVSPIAPASGVGGVCWAGRVFTSFSRLFFLVSCFPFVGSSLPALRGVWRCLL